MRYATFAMMQVCLLLIWRKSIFTPGGVLFGLVGQDFWPTEIKELA